MNRSTPRTLTWLTLVAAVASALLLSGEDAALPDLSAGGAAAVLLSGGGGGHPRHAPHKTWPRPRDLDPQRR